MELWKKSFQIESLLPFFDLSLFHDMTLAFDALNQIWVKLLPFLGNLSIFKYMTNQKAVP